MHNQQWLVIVYGEDRPERTRVAEQIARSLNGKTALVRQRDLVDRWIVSHGDDAEAEFDMAYMQVKLLVANYMRNRFNVIVDAAYAHHDSGRILSYDEEIDQLPALMRAMPVRSVTVLVHSSDATPSGVGAERSVPRHVWRQRSGLTDLSFDLSRIDPESIADEVAAIIREA